MPMNVRNRWLAVPAAALLALGTTGAAGAQGVPPLLAAQLNAGTAYTGIGPAGYVGVGISAVVPKAPELLSVEVAGVQIGYANDGGSPTLSTLGAPDRAALLNAGTAWTGIGPTGRIGVGIAGPLPAPPLTALADDEAVAE